MERKTIDHIFEPVYDEKSEILILGTMPSPKSRELGFYYSHPQNKFWRILSDIFNFPYPESVREKRELLFDNKIALWDVLKSCSISGADDASIREPIPNAISSVLEASSINSIFTTGKKAYTLYNKYCLNETGVKAVYLPSTSPANCRYYTYEQLREIYRSALVTSINSKENIK